MNKGPVVFNLFSVALLKGERASADTLDILFVDDHEFFRDAAPLFGNIQRPQIPDRILQFQVVRLAIQDRERVRNIFLLANVDQASAPEGGADRTLVSRDNDQ